MQGKFSGTLHVGISVTLLLFATPPAARSSCGQGPHYVYTFHCGCGGQVDHFNCQFPGNACSDCECSYSCGYVCCGILYCNGCYTGNCCTTPGQALLKNNAILALNSSGACGSPHAAGSDSSRQTGLSTGSSKRTGSTAPTSKNALPLANSR
jgi:hypothetical protein